MPPELRPVPRFVAEPPHEGRPYGRWSDALTEHLLEAVSGIDTDEDLGEPGPINWFPDRTFHGRTYIPGTSTTSTGFELLGYVSYTREHEGAEARDFESFADYTDETAEANPDWKLDLSDRELASWHGGDTRRGEITLVWGVSLVSGGALATAELGPTTVDQCELADDRFTLVALDNYTGDFLDVKLWGKGGGEMAAESLYEDDEEDDEDEDDSDEQ
jgi:hypothetical protein